MKVRVAKQRVDNGQALEVMTNVQLFGHAHAAVQLHSVLAHELTGLTNLNLKCADGFLCLRALALIHTHGRHKHQ